MQTGSYCIGIVLRPNVLVMGAFSDLVAMAMGLRVNSLTHNMGYSEGPQFQLYRDV